MLHIHRYVLKQPFRQDGHDRYVIYGPTITIFLHGQFFTLPNRWIFVVTSCSLRNPFFI